MYLASLHVEEFCKKRKEEEVEKKLQQVVRESHCSTKDSACIEIGQQFTEH